MDAKQPGASVLELMGTGCAPRTIDEAHYLSDLTVAAVFGPAEGNNWAAHRYI